jgi:hyperosmotically inducible periplasmic protein
MRRLLSALILLTLLTAGVTAVFAQKQVSDDQIYDLVRQRLANDADVKGGAFEVDVKAGVVTIRGAVEKEKFKQKAERIVKKVKGVKGVVNELKVKS